MGTLPDSIVVTASRFPEDARYTGRRVSVWTAAEIERLPVTSVDDLLRTVAGVDVQSRGGFGIQSDLSIGGSGFNGVLLLLDGAPVNDPMTGHFLADLPVPLSEIARVEVLRGPAAAVYGPDALGGVVQLFTYSGIRSDTSPSPIILDGELHGGEHALYDVSASAEGRLAGLHLDAATSWEGTDGEPVAGDAARTDFRRRVHTAAASSRSDDVQIFGRIGWDDREFGAFHFYTPFESDTAREATSTLWGQFRLRSDGWTAQVHAKQHFDRYVYNPVTAANEHTSRMLNGYAERRWKLSEATTLSSGTEVGLRGIDSNNLSRHQDVSAGTFVSVHWRNRAFAVRLAGHADYDPAYGVELSPQLFLAATRGALTLHAGVARAVRAPNYVERYYNTTLASPRGGNLGNPDLQPERAWSVQGGISFRVHPDVALHATSFRRTTSDLIDYAMSSPADTVFLARNLHHVQTKGIEVELDARTRLAFADVAITVSYSHLDADLGDVDENVSFKYALAHARHLLQSTLSTGWGRFGVSFRGLYKDPIDGSSYVVAHAQVSYRQPISSGHIGLSVQLRNVFDETYSDIFDAPMPGRWWMAGISWHPW